MSNVNISSFRALEELEISIARFADRTSEGISAAQSKIALQRATLDEIVILRRREVERWQETYDTADNEDDDVGYILRRLQEAEDRHNEARQWQRRVEDICDEFQRRATEATHLADEHADKARLFLKERLRELYEYVGLKAGSEHNVSGSSHQPGSIGPQTTASSAAAAPDLSNFALPKGFDWISISQLSPDALASLPSENEYRKDDLSAADMRAGLELLRTRILPEIEQNPERATRDYFAEIDVVENRDVSNSLAEIYGAYFGRDAHIWVDRFKGEQYFRIGNGRHRIAVARELGWTVIPGRIEEV